MDIDINNEKGRFKLRVSGIIVNGNKILVHESKRFKGFSFPGGHVELGETTKDAILREIKEEVGIDVRIIDIFAINENIYNNEDNVTCHEINYYFKLESLVELPDNIFEVKEIDKGVEKSHIFHWLSIDSLKENNLQPIDITKLIVEDINKDNYIFTSDYR